eukprot:Lithocolla_globosa_v1_NODE_9058_length_751_cov_55.754310.p1 type:complete len:204 gc:universal NODE_9058_length_751_cov_55.754310:64-675(+)
MPDGVSKKIPEFKLAIAGGGGVGKSSLTVRVIHQQFLVEYDPTIEDVYRKECVVDDETIMLDILDSGGQDEYAALRDQYMKTGEGFILVFSLTSKSSFEELAQFVTQIYNAKDQDKTDSHVPMVIVGNKSDLENEREVSKDEGKNFADTVGAPYFETSAKTNTNVQECFFQAVREVKKLRAGITNKPAPTPVQKEKGGCCVTM